MKRREFFKKIGISILAILGIGCKSKPEIIEVKEVVNDKQEAITITYPNDIFISFPDGSSFRGCGTVTESVNEYYTIDITSGFYVEDNNES